MISRMVSALAVTALMVAVLSGCHEKQASVPPPQEIGDAAIGQFCGMPLAEHSGPKGQVVLWSRLQKPLWFVSVRDAVAFTMLPEEPKDVAAIYVSDMAATDNWDRPAAGAWVEARKAWFVINSRRTGGMGTAEAVPFSTPEAARRFVADHGGQTVRFEAIPQDYVLGDGVQPFPVAGGPTP